VQDRVELPQVKRPVGRGRRDGAARRAGDEQRHPRSIGGGVRRRSRVSRKESERRGRRAARSSSTVRAQRPPSKLQVVRAAVVALSCSYSRGARRYLLISSTLKGKVSPVISQCAAGEISEQGKEERGVIEQNAGEEGRPI
jgi:hypothetical protein